MGLFDFFKDNQHNKKVGLAYKCYKPEMVGMVFPGGKEQASRIIKSLAVILGIDLSALKPIDYYNVLTIYSGVLIRRVVTKSTDEHIIVSLQANHKQYIKNEMLAQQVLAYCTINMKNNSFALESAEDINALNMFDNILTQNRETSRLNEEAQKENLDDDEYGLVPHKPIYTTGVGGSEKYLRSLMTSDGKAIIWDRRGSMSVDGVNGMIDIYDISYVDGKRYKTIYINMYGTSISQKAPNGFRFK